MYRRKGESKIEFVLFIAMAFLAVIFIFSSFAIVSKITAVETQVQTRLNREGVIMNCECTEVAPEEVVKEITQPSTEEEVVVVSDATPVPVEEESIEEEG